MLWCHLQLSADVVVHQFPEKILIFVLQKIIVANTTADEHLLHAIHPPQALQKRRILRVVGVQIPTRLRGQTAAALAHPPPLLLGAGGVAEVGGGTSHIVDIALELRVLRQQLRLPHHGLDGAGGDHAPLMKGQCAEVAAAEAAPVVGDGEAYLLDGGNLLPIHGVNLPDIGQVVQGIQCLPAQWTGRRIHHQHPALTGLQHGAPPDGIVLVVLDLGGSGVGRLVGAHLLIGGTGHRMKAAALSGGRNVGGAGDVGDLTGRHLSG